MVSGPLDGQQIVGTVLRDDAGSHLARGVQRIEGDQRAGDGGYLQQCADRRQLAIPVMKVEARQRHATAVLDQRRSLVAHRAVAIGAANPLAVGRQRLPLRLRYGYWQPRLGIAVQRASSASGSAFITTRRMTDLVGGS